MLERNSWLTVLPFVLVSGSPEISQNHETHEIKISEESIDYVPELVTRSKEKTTLATIKPIVKEAKKDAALSAVGGSYRTSGSLGLIAIVVLSFLFVDL